MPPLTLAFSEPAATRLEHSGGKGANLSLLTQRGFPVPSGFVVTAHVYREFIAGARELLAEVGQLTPADTTARRAWAERARAALARHALPPVAVDEIRARLATAESDQAWSVRSSSTMEDLANAAFAGQHETFLNCRGAERILDRIKACYLSLWADRAIAYRQQQGFDHARAAMAVVVQHMVPCDVAGVAFSINPISGDLGELVIDANFGLGESVVSGEGEVDHFVVTRATRSVRTASIAPKTRRIVTAADGVREAEVEAAEASRPALDEPQIRELAGLLLQVETGYGFPQDIEWGIAGGRLYLLQSRPITAIPPRWTRDESAERFPNVITPLTWDFVAAGFHRSLNHSFRIMGLPPFTGQWFGMHGHYIYGNQNAVELYGRRTPFAPRNLEELRVALPVLRGQFGWVLELPVSWQRDLDHYLLRIGEFLAEPLAERSPAEVWDYVRRVNEHGSQYFLPNIAISLTQGTLYRFLHHLLRLVVGPEEANGCFDRLMGFCETKTGLINQELLELARVARATGFEPVLRAAPSRELADRAALAGFAEFRGRFEKFLRDHGHREVEFDAYVPTWVEAPWVVLDHIRLLLDGPLDETADAAAHATRRAQQDAEHELWRRVPEDLRYFCSEILRLARLYTSLDDLEHYQTTRLTLPLRRGLRELGARLVARGVMTDPLDVFFAHEAQIGTALAGDDAASWSTLAEQIRAQKAAYLADRARTPAWSLEEGAGGGTEDADARTLTGLAGSAGQAEGPAFIVRGSDDFARFPKGAVLLARTTSPTWTPLFYSAAAVVTESGGPLSHGAVTAREMRIPAVMSVRGVLGRVRDGQRLRVDGTHGRVHLLD